MRPRPGLVGRRPQVRSAKAAVAFIGLNPSRWEPGLTASPSRSVTKEGSSALRLAHYQAANVARQHEPGLAAHYWVPMVGWLSPFDSNLRLVYPLHVPSFPQVPSAEPNQLLGSRHGIAATPWAERASEGGLWVGVTDHFRHRLVDQRVVGDDIENVAPAERSIERSLDAEQTCLGGVSGD